LIRTASAIPNDFDTDGTSDIVTVTSPTSGLRTWSIIPSSAPGSPITFNFGISSDSLTLGSWFVPNSPVVGIARADTVEAGIIWKALNSTSTAVEEELGALGSFALSGGDFFGDGVVDGAVVRNVAGKIRWRVRNSLLADPSITPISFILGRNGARAFYMSLDGLRDWAAIIEPQNSKNSRVRLRNVQSGQVRTFRKFPRSLTRGSRPRPFPIRSIEGTDVLGFLRQDAADTTLSVYRLDGTRIQNITIVGLATVVVGEYNNSDPGEEILFQTGTKLTTYNPFSGISSEQTSPTGTIVGEINGSVVG
jgi:hypothetical protein